jgi:hypothetical protein
MEKVNPRMVTAKIYQAYFLTLLGVAFAPSTK